MANSRKEGTVKTRRLVDHRLAQERRAYAAQRDGQMVRDYGEFLSNLKPWAWYLTITFCAEVGREPARAAVERYLQELQEAAGNPIAWVMAEDLGKIGGRYHCHLLVDGVGHLSRKSWW